MILDDVPALLSKCSIPKSIQLAAGSSQGFIANDVNLSMGGSTFSNIIWIVMQQLEERPFQFGYNFVKFKIKLLKK